MFGNEHDGSTVGIMFCVSTSLEDSMWLSSPSSIKKLEAEEGSPSPRRGYVWSVSRSSMQILPQRQLVIPLERFV